MVRRFCTKCDDRAVWCPTWDLDEWRCPSCGESVASRSGKGLVDRAIALVLALYTEDEATRLRVAALLEASGDAATLRAVLSAWPVVRPRTRSTTTFKAVSWLCGCGAVVAYVWLAVALLFAATPKWSVGVGAVPREFNPPVDAWTVVVPMVLAVVAFASKLWSGRIVFASTGREAWVARTIGASLTSHDDPALVGVLALAWRQPELTDAIEPKLARLLGAFTAAHAGSLDEQDLRALTALLAPHDPSPRPETIRALIHALSLTAHLDAALALDAMADGKSWDELASSTRSEARRAAGDIRRRISEAAERPSLLRAADAGEADSRSLLRPATSGEEPPEQLLRRGEPE